MSLIWQTSPTFTRPWVSVFVTYFLKNLCPFPIVVDIILPLINLWSLLLLFSCLVMSDSLKPHGLQLGRLPCPSPTPGVCSNLCSLSWWCHPIILSSVILFSSSLQSLPASESVSKSQLFASGGQIGASASVLPMNIQDWFPLGWTGWIFLQSKGLSRVFSNTTVRKYHSLVLSPLYGPTLTSVHDY